MKASFPRFGYDTYALKTFLEHLGAEVVLPPSNSRRTIELGVLHSPELVCMPYKITLGNFLEALDLGADTLFMAAGARKCRFGYYHYLQDRALTVLGRRCRFIPVTQYSPFEFVFRAMPGVFHVSPLRVIRAIRVLLAKSKLTQEFRECLNRKRAVDFEAAEKAKPAALKVIDKARTLPEIRRARWRVKEMFALNGRRPEIRLGLVGEIYFMIEQFANQDIEKELARMGAEVVFERSLYRHVRHLLFIDPAFARSTRLARKYLEESPGGEAHRTVGESVHFIRNGADGIVHIFPFTCMPENIAYEALQQISEESGVPLLSLSFDEHTSATGLLTRLEAFVDLVKRRKSRAKQKVEDRRQE
jgi:predicted nucleotide-binding protein (sugar kinase/HSP70/actin superfamily)